jgi:hypothetical protein
MKTSPWPIFVKQSWLTGRFNIYAKMYMGNLWIASFWCPQMADEFADLLNGKSHHEK